MSHLYKIFLPSFNTLFSEFSSSVRKLKRLETKLDLFCFLSPKCRGEAQTHKTHQPPQNCHWAQWEAYDPPLIPPWTCHPIELHKTLGCNPERFGFHQPKISEENSTAPLPIPAPVHHHEPHQQRHPQCSLLGPGVHGHGIKRSHAFTTHSLCFVSEIARLRCSTHSITEPCLEGNPLPFIFFLCLLAS